MKARTAAVEYILSLSPFALIQILVREKIFYIAGAISSISVNFKKNEIGFFCFLVFFLFKYLLALQVSPEDLQIYKILAFVYYQLRAADVEKLL